MKDAFRFLSIIAVLLFSHNPAVAGVCVETDDNRDDLSVYSELAHALVGGLKLHTTVAQCEADKPLESQNELQHDAPTRPAVARAVYIFRSGVGMYSDDIYDTAFDPYATYGPEIRFETEDWAIGIDSRAMVRSLSGFSFDMNATGHLIGMKFIDTDSVGKFYVGGGLGYGVFMRTSITQNHGFEGLSFVGYEMASHYNVRMGGQLDVTLPMYSGDNVGWPSQIVLSVGIGHGHGRQE